MARRMFQNPNCGIMPGAVMRLPRYLMLSLVLPPVLAGSARAADLNVPTSTYPTIQSAINAAVAGDRILVAPGVYPESLDVTQRVTIQSTGGAATTIIQANVNDTPVVKISFDGVTLDGFTVFQQDPGPAGAPPAANAAVLVAGDLVKTYGVVIQNCILKGNQTDQGILVRPNLEGGKLVVKNNQFAKDAAATFGFKDGICFDSKSYGDPINDKLAAHTAVIELVNNSILEFDHNAVYFTATVHKSQIKISQGTFTPVAPSSGPTAGVYFARDVSTFSDVEIAGLTMSGVSGGVYLNDEVNRNSNLVVRNATIQNYKDFAVAVYCVYDLSSLTLDTVTLAGSGSAEVGVAVSDVYGLSRFTLNKAAISGFDSTGLYLANVEYGSTAAVTSNTVTGNKASLGLSLYEVCEGASTTITNNTVSGFTGVGLYNNQYCDGSELILTNNTFTADTSGADCGFCSETGFDYAARAVATGNKFTGFTSEGWSSRYCNDGSDVVLTNNVFTAHSSGADWPIDLWDGVDYGSTATLTGNQVTGYTDTGLYVDYVDDAARFTATGNTFTAHSDGGNHGMYVDYVDWGAELTLSGNQFRGFTYAGFECGDVVDDGAVVTLTGNTFAAHTDGAGFGIYFAEGWSDGGFDYGSVGTITGNTVSGFRYVGLYVEGYVDDGAELYVDGNTFTAHADGADCGICMDDYIEYGPASFSSNTITGFTGTGLYIDYIDDGSQVAVDNNILTAHADGAPCGIYNNGVEDGAVATFDGNTITGVKSVKGGVASCGMLFYDSWSGATLSVCDNTVTAHADGAANGIHFQYPPGDGSTMSICNNRISGFADISLYFGGHSSDGGLLEINDNQLTGGSYGIYFADELEAGLAATISGNSLANFTKAGVYFDDLVWTVDLVIRENRLTGAATPADAGVHFEEDMSAATTVTLLGNCFKKVVNGVQVVGAILDTAAIVAQYNDFSGTTTGVKNVGGDAAHTINAEYNWWASATKTGNVDWTPKLTAVPDTDADGVPNCTDQCPDTQTGQAIDANGCSCWQLDPDGDRDGDGVLNCDDGCPDDPNKSKPGVCGCGKSDLDTDGDGTADCKDGCPNDPLKTKPGDCGCGKLETDTDGDATPDCIDGCPKDSDKTEPGVCGCGKPDADTDGDGVLDCKDECPKDADKTKAGLCGCGKEDVDTDGDGTLDCNDGCPDDPDKVAPGPCGCGLPDTDTDGDGRPDCFDLCPDTDDLKDTDGDGTVDCLDQCPDDPRKTSPGACGCGQPDDDDDGDDVPNCLDGCPDDATKLEPGACGCGHADADGDADGVLDCRDNCPDVANPDQADGDGNGLGDACDEAGRVIPTCGAGLCGAGVAPLLPLTVLAMVGLKLRSAAGRKRR